VRLEISGNVGSGLSSLLDSHSLSNRPDRATVRRALIAGLYQVLSFLLRFRQFHSPSNRLIVKTADARQ